MATNLINQLLENKRLLLKIALNQEQLQKKLNVLLATLID